MTRYEADEALEIISLSVAFISLIFIVVGLTEPVSFIVVSGVMIIVNLISFYVLNWLDEIEESEN